MTFRCINLNLEFFIAKRVALGAKGSFSRFIASVATAAVALSIAVMIIATSLVGGFQDEIRNKVFGFWAHIHILPISNSSIDSEKPISIDQSFYPNPEKLGPIKHIQVVAFKGAMIQSETDFEKSILKGVGPDFSWDFFKDYMVKGEVFIVDTASEINYRPIIISQVTAKRLALDTGQSVIMSIFDMDGRDRSRKFEIVGIYNTGLEEFDELFALTDIRIIQEINGWEKDEVGGFELFLDEVEMFKSRATSYFLIAFGWTLNDRIYFRLSKDPIQIYSKEIKSSIAYKPELTTVSVRDFNPNIFDWLELQTTNEFLILLIMTGVAIINMITTLLILILERTQMTGVLKSLGAKDFSIQKVFLYTGLFILGGGALIGNSIALLLIFLQKNFNLIKLPEESYYVSTAPVSLDLSWMLAINFGAILICLLVLLIPSILVRRINPVKAIRLD